jgi:nicotinamidase-related amidase
MTAMTDQPRLLARNDTALLVIDVQQRIDGVMADHTHRPRLAVLVDGCRALGVPVIATEQYPKGLGATIDDLAARLPEAAIVKETFSCAREPAARQAIQATGRRQVIVTGIEAHVCVLQTVLDLIGEGFEVHVPHDAVNSRRPSDKRWALHRMAAAGAVVTSTESALFELLERCGTDEFRAVSRLVKELPVEGEGAGS